MTDIVALAQVCTDKNQKIGGLEPRFSKHKK
jgi:hypothetical protein